MTQIAYIDASALTKVVVDEADSGAMLRCYAEAERVACSRIGVVEVRRAVGRRRHDRDHLDAVIASVEIMEFDSATAERASAMAPRGLRTLDAIHLATAAGLLGELGAFVTYDLRQAEAARALGLPVLAPA